MIRDIKTLIYYLNSFYWNELRYDRRSGNCNLCYCKLSRNKSFRTWKGFETMASPLALQCSTKWAMKIHTLGAGQFAEFKCVFLQFISSSFYVNVNQQCTFLHWGNLFGEKKLTIFFFQIQALPSHPDKSKNHNINETKVLLIFTHHSRCRLLFWHTNTVPFTSSVAAL